MNVRTLWWVVLVIGLVWMVACAPAPAPAPTAAPQATTAPVTQATTAPVTQATTAPVTQATAAPAEPVTIEYWNGHTGPDGVVMNKLVADYMKLNPNVKINVTSLAWDALFTKASLAMQSHQGPDLMSVPMDRMSAYKDTIFQDVTNDFKDMDPSKFDSYLYNLPVFDGKRYGIPLDTHPYALYYRKDLFDQNKVPYPPSDRPMTKDEFLTTAKAMTKGDMYGFAFKATAYHAWWDLWGLFLQNGGQLYNADKTQLTLNTPAAKDAINFYLDLRKQGLASNENMDWTTAYTRFQQGKAAMLIHGSWLIPALDAAKVQYGVAMFPQIGKDYAAFANVHQFVFTKLDPKRHAAAVKFVKWFEQTENATQWGLSSGNVPALLSARAEYAKDPRFVALSKTAEAMKGRYYMYPYIGPKNDTIQFSVIVPTLEKIYRGDISVDDGFAKIAADGAKALAQ